MALIPVTFKHSTEIGKEKSGKVSTITARMLYANTFSGKVGIVKGYKRDDETDELSVSYDGTGTTPSSFRLVFNKGAVSIYGGIGIVEQGTTYDIPKGLTNYSLGIRVDLTQPAGNEMMFYHKPASESLTQDDLQIHDTDGVYEFELFKITTTGDAPAVGEKTTQYIQSVNDFLESKLKDLGFYEGSINLSSIVTATENKVTRQGNYVIGNLVISNLNIENLNLLQNSYSYKNFELGTLDAQFLPKSTVIVPFSAPISVNMGYDTYGVAYVYTSVCIYPSGNVELRTITYGTRNASGAINIRPNTNHASMRVILNFGYQTNPIT